MSDEPQNPNSEDSSLPVAPQEPTLDASIPTTTSAPTEMPPEAPEASRQDATIDVGKDPNGAINTIEEKTPEPEQNPESEPSNPPTQTAHSSKDEPFNEPFDSSNNKPPVSRNWIRTLLSKANLIIQLRKRKKLEKIMTLFLKKPQIKNDEVEKLLHVSDATATRYLSQLEKEGRIKQTGKTGYSVFYTKI